MLTILRKKLLQVKKNSLGAALVEFTFMVPVLFLILAGGYQAFRYITLTINLDAIASQVAKWTSTQVSSANIEDCFIGAWLLGQADTFSTQGQIIVSGITNNKTGTNPKLAWQVKTANAVSTIAVQTDKKITSTSFPLADAQQLIVVEVNYQHMPFFSFVAAIFPAITLYKVAQTVPQNTAQFNSFS